MLVISVFLLGETRAHAQLLGNRTVDGVESGRFKQSLDLLRFKTDINASVSRAAVTVADVPPQYFPSAVIEDVVYRDSYEVVQVTINGTQPTPGPTATPAPEPQDPPSDSGANTGLIIGVAIAAAAVLVAVVAAAIIIIMHKRRRAAEGTVRTVPRGLLCFMKELLLRQLLRIITSVSLLIITWTYN